MFNIAGPIMFDLCWTIVGERGFSGLTLLPRRSNKGVLSQTLVKVSTFIFAVPWREIMYMIAKLFCMAVELTLL
jgi:hypothetical protein